MEKIVFSHIFHPATGVVVLQRGNDLTLPGKTSSTADCVLPVQTHSLNVAEVTDPNDCFPETDALVTKLKNVAIGIRTADCVPIVIYAPDIEAVAAVHAGWKGSLGGIAGITADHLIEDGANPELMKVIFGCSICKDCYEVDQDLADRFISAGFSDCVSMPEGAGKPHIDLQGVNVRRLLDKGVRKENILINRDCTLQTTDSKGNHAYHSWRRTPGVTERNITAIMFTK